MGSATIVTAALAVGISLVLPSWAGLARYHCLPGSTFPDYKDNTRYYRCVGDGSIQSLQCESGIFCSGESEDQLCCNDETSDSTYESWSSSKSEEDKDNHSHKNGHEEHSSEECSHESGSPQVKSDEDDRSYDFVGWRFQYPSTKIPEYHTHSSEEDEPLDEDKHEETYTIIDEDRNVSFEVSEPIHPDAGSENIHDSDVGDYGTKQQEDFNSSNDEVDSNNYSHYPHIIEIAESHSAESNDQILEASHTIQDSEEHVESKQAPEDNRKKRNADETGDEDLSTTEKVDEDNEKEKMNNKDQEREVEDTTVMDAEESKVDDLSNQNESDSVAHDSLETTPDNNKDDEILIPESGEENNVNPEKTSDEIPIPESGEDKILEKTDIPSSHPVAVNPSLVAVHQGAPLAHSYLDYKTQQIIQIVRSILWLADEKPTLTHREMLSPEIYEGVQNPPNLKLDP